MEVIFEFRSIGLFMPESPFRMFCIQVAEAKWFEYAISLIIMWSMVVVAAEGPPGRPKSEQSQMLFDASELFFLLIFWLECAIKVVAFGFVNHPCAYLRGKRTLVAERRYHLIPCVFV